MNFICLKYPRRTTSTILINAESEECVLFCFKSDMLNSYITDLRDDKKLAQFNKKKLNIANPSTQKNMFHLYIHVVL